MRLDGYAKNAKEQFRFRIEPSLEGGFLLCIRFGGDTEETVAGAGVWPSVEKAKSVAENTASKLLPGATVCWNEM